MDTSSIPGLELIQIADVVAREKSIDREEVIVAMEEAIQKAVLSEDPAFYRGLDELGISVFDMNEADDAATAGPDDAGS